MTKPLARKRRPVTVIVQVQPHACQPHVCMPCVRPHADNNWTITPIPNWWQTPVITISGGTTTNSIEGTVTS